MGEISGGQLTVDALLDKGVDKIFSVSGGHIFPLYDCAECSPIELFTTRHEQAAVFMAEAWGRMNRRPGTALVTAGPGFANAVTAIANAKLANSPLVLLSGVVGLHANEKLDLQDMRQLPVIEPLVKKALCCHRTERIPEYIDMAYRIAASGCPGPVYLEIPVDVWNGQAEETRVKRIHSWTETRSVDLEKADRLVEMIAAAERPIFIAGSGAYYSGAEAAFKTFIEAVGAPAFTSAQGRGLLSDTHPLCFASSTLIRPGAAFDALVETDLVVLLGNRISLYYASGEVFNPAAKIVQVDINQAEIGRNRSIDLGIVSDVRSLLAQVNRLMDTGNLAQSCRERFAPWVAHLKEKASFSKDLARFNWESDKTPIHHMRTCAEVDRFMDRPDDIVVADGGDTQVWLSMTRTVRRPGHYLESGLFGCLGVGLPYAQAAQLRYPGKRVCLVTGDGSIGFNFMEFETCLRKGLPVVVVICNDKQWGMIRHAQEVKLGRCIAEGTEIGMVDYHKAVEAFGGKGVLVEAPEEIAPALADAFASGKTACINVMTDPEPISPGSLALAAMGGHDVSQFMA
ncbi:MAG: thiamine pyrophosphate-binding protein [Desulfobacterales bacterium]|nr:thiamine pyrophosphate-binding protein [Desulfobacterales bacterium]